MAHDTTNRGGQDRRRINVSQEHELRDWPKRLNVTPEQLKEAVKAVGDNANDVEIHLADRRASSTAEKKRKP